LKQLKDLNVWYPHGLLLLLGEDNADIIELVGLGRIDLEVKPKSNKK
jgi:hypothetical protein